MVKHLRDKDPYLAREAQKYETPVPSREYILTVLDQQKEPMRRSALVAYFSLASPDLEEAFRRRIKAMIRDGQLLKTPQGLIPIKEAQMCEGVIVMEREGEASLRTQKSNQTILLAGITLRGYYNGDEVKVQITQIDRNGVARARIVQLLNAVKPLFVGRLMATHQGLQLLPFDRKFTQNIAIPKDKAQNAQNGDIVQVEIMRDEILQYPYVPCGKVIEILGDFATPGIEINMALRKSNLSDVWTQAVLQECEKWESHTVENLPSYKDLTELPLVTIDGEDAKDFDDAVYCEFIPPRGLGLVRGGYRLWVAIADVSHYVKKGSALDKEALERGNSTYFPGKVIPMLPEILSNELCSLKPHVTRLSMVCQMHISTKGVVTRSEFYSASIRSKARLTYTQVTEMLNGNEILRAQHVPLLPSIEALHQLYHALQSQRKKRGAIDFDTVETRIIFDKVGKIKSIIPQERTIAHKMIEESMLAANVCAANFIKKHKRAALFRVHERPVPDKLADLRKFLSELGLSLPGRKTPNAKDFSAVLEQIKTRPDRHIIQIVLLRSLMQAQYTPHDIGHFGLSYDSYLHFTSPIRRYPDLITHRVIADILQDKKRKSDPSEWEQMEKWGAHCSTTERRSDDAVRDATLALKCHYMQDKVGEVFHGVISGVASFGIFVELKDIYIEGLIHVSALGAEYFHYDPAHHRMIGEHSRTIFCLGGACEVRVVRVDMEAKKIDLELLHNQQSHKRSSHAQVTKHNQQSHKRPPHAPVTKRKNKRTRGKPCKR